MSERFKSLVERLNPLCRAALEEAASLAQQRGNPVVSVDHFFLKVLERQNTDVHLILRHFGADPSDFMHELSVESERLNRGSTGLPGISDRMIRVLETAWLTSSLPLGLRRIRSGSVLIGFLDEGLTALAKTYGSLSSIPSDVLTTRFAEIVAASSENEDGARAELGVDGVDTPALDQFTVDLTEEAREGRIDPIRGRDDEIRQIIDILTRRRQNNPILTGEAGVGKTAVVEGFAQRVADGGVPPGLEGATVRALDLGLLQAGAGVRGEFEQRLKAVIDEVKASPGATILFIDEAHTLIGAGAQEGKGDAANLLKPALARGELRTIAATTWSEYKRYFEKDPALARRFQVINVVEPTEEVAVDMLRGVAPRLEDHHGVRILDGAVRSAVSLSHRYLMGRRLPDKAIGVLDTAAARVAIAQAEKGSIAPIEDIERKIRTLEDEIAVVQREAIGSGRAAKDTVSLRETLLESREEHALLEARRKKEQELVGRLIEVRSRLEELLAAGEGDDDELERAEREHAAIEEDLRSVQSEAPMVPAFVGPREVASVISGWTGVPVGKVLSAETQVILELRDRLEERVVGQTPALDIISRRIRTYRAKLDDPRKPVGVFLLVGPSGVGKTETALAVADVLYGGERSLVVLNMSEYQEAHTVSGLKGAPPGYVGYGTGGVLTEAVRRTPYCVLLLDEVEKAHPDVLELFYQVFDKGVMEDGEGQLVDFRNTVILLTSNLGGEVLAAAAREGGEDRASDVDVLTGAVRPELLRHFAPAFLGRLVVVPYTLLTDDQIRLIARLKLDRLIDRMKESHDADLVISDRVVDELVKRCTEVDSGARNLDHILTQSLLPELSSRILGRMADELPIRRAEVDMASDGSFDVRLLTDPEADEVGG